MTPILEFTGKDKQKIQILEQELDLEKFDDKGLPADTHMVTYEIEDKTLIDAVRAYNKVDIFDAYFDKLKGHWQSSKDTVWLRQCPTKLIRQD
jgi:hypothetical protein